MSLMFPTIYGIALEGMGDDAKFGAAGLIMAILGGSVLPPVQAAIIDCGTIFGFPSVNISFVVPLICFIVVALLRFSPKSHNGKKEIKPHIIGDIMRSGCLRNSSRTFVVYN